jgi:hypothetical protein
MKIQPALNLLIRVFRMVEALSGQGQSGMGNGADIRIAY